VNYLVTKHSVEISTSTVYHGHHSAGHQAMCLPWKKVPGLIFPILFQIIKYKYLERKQTVKDVVNSISAKSV
jgi:hypothetical protein